MNKDNQTSSDSINAYIPISANSSNDSTTETFATIVQETTLPTTTTEKGGSSGMISFICIGILACICFYIWKILKTISASTQKMQNLLVENQNRLKNAEEKIEILNNEIKSLTSKVFSISKSSTPKSINTVIREEQPIYQYTDKKEESFESNQVKFATLQSPDENGILRFSERSMVDSPSSPKMFLLEIDVKRGIGTYKINPSAINLILGDLQMFKDFVKPFTFSGDTNNVTIQDKRPGKISKQGNYWVVDELLEITIH